MSQIPLKASTRARHRLMSPILKQDFPVKKEDQIRGLEGGIRFLGLPNTPRSFIFLKFELLCMTSPSISESPKQPTDETVKE